MSITIEQFVERLTQSGLMSAAEVSTFQDSLPPDKRPKDVQQFAQALVQHKKLTKYQAKAVYEGKGKSLVFDEYVVLDQIGEGGMGVVLKAQHRRMKRIVAVKMLPAATMKSPDAVQRFYREVEAAAKLSHPNIVTAYDAREHGGRHCLVMEYVEGKDLAAVVKEHGPLPVPQAIECILQAARGLQYAHEQGVVHRDIKPGNLLLSKSGTVKILDMGLARIAGPEAAMGGPERLTTTGQVMGTCDYMAPEQAMDCHAVDARADIYALGCTLYRLLLSQPPYHGQSLMQILMAHREAAIPSICQTRPEVPAELDAVFQKMVAKEPGDRQQSMAEVIAELEAVLAVLSGHVATPAAAKAESSSAALSRSLAFLQEDGMPVIAGRPRKPTAAERTLPHIEQKSTEDTGKSILGMPLAAVARVRRKPLLLVLLAVCLVLLLGIVLTITLRHGTLVVEIDENLGKDVQVTVSQGGEQVKVVDASSGWTLSLSPGKYDLAVQGGDDKFQLDPQSVTVTRGGQAKVKVTLKPTASVATATTWPADSPVGKTGAPSPAVAPFDTAKAEEYQAAWAKHLNVPVEITNSIGMKLVLIPPGEFIMGSPKELIEEELKRPDTDQWYKDLLPGEGPKHPVRITRAFYLGVYHVTQGEYERVMGTNPSEFSATGKGKDKVAGQDTKRFPVENVSWNDSVEFCRKLSNLRDEKTAGRLYVLPTEAQWEYACRAGSIGRYSFSSGRGSAPRESEEHELPDYGWFGNNAGGMTHAVGRKRPSAWGLYDIHGDVWEWCQDWYDKDYYAASPQNDPSGPPGGLHRAHRGGSWHILAGNCRSAFRDRNAPWYHDDHLGFRVSLVLPDTADGRKTVPSTQYSVLSTPPEAADPSIRNPRSSARHRPLRRYESQGASSCLGQAPRSAGGDHQLDRHEAGAHPVGGVPDGLAPGTDRGTIEGQHRRPLVDGAPAERGSQAPRADHADVLSGRVCGHASRMGEGDGHEPQRVFGDWQGQRQGGRARHEAVPGGNGVVGRLCRVLPEAVGLARGEGGGARYRLPSEAQWEYACRAGNPGRYGFSAGRRDIPREYEEHKLADYAWFSDNSGGMPHPVGMKRPNAWGLYDMQGNVWQWCQDWYDKDYYQASPVDDPPGLAGGSYRVYRGGGWHHPAGYCRSAYRGSHKAGYRSHDYGLRVSLVLVDR